MKGISDWPNCVLECVFQCVFVTKIPYKKLTYFQIFTSLSSLH